MTERSIKLIRAVCELSGSPTFLSDVQQDLASHGIIHAVDAHDTATLFNWLLTSFSYQGISDNVVSSYIQQHGNIGWHQIYAELAREPSCPRLRNYWRFANCEYNKTSASCSELGFIERCPLPRHPLRNGRLNQIAYSFFLFIRDHARSDIVGWIDHRLSLGLPEDKALISPLREVFGISDKILTMSLSNLLLCAPEHKPHWFTAGKNMIAVDSLVHNFLHRTGILKECHAEHLYGLHCYRPGGCADIIKAVAGQIDVRGFNPAFPENFPRFVQNAIWRYCAGEHFNMCNGNRINDRNSCPVLYCQVGSVCSRTPLKNVENG